MDRRSNGSRFLSWHRTVSVANATTHFTHYLFLPVVAGNTLYVAGGTNWIGLSKSPLRASLLHSTPLHSTPFHSIPLHSTPLRRTARHSTAFHCTALHC